ncbi:uncharacterized protein PV06_11501 [Exophiala oligosperma]|uniref:Uncharacterized protein n=1 Tax=Exophiala oligosperma TaxID=215243 RepID=A0A0D2DKD3_9EURO|nr:uncharacterized protein PV06_11501 [Exophiala oligosperma]KIW36204.1 hypothetical protein PV06_11501 [Exophiala oligosperma]
MPPAHLEPDDMITLGQQCISLDIRLEVHRFCDKLQELAATGEPAIMVITKFFILFTGKLYTMAIEQSTTPIPTNLQNKWTERTGCGCEMCLQLDFSSAIPHKKSYRSLIDRGIDQGIDQGIGQPFWKENEPENETQVEPGFTLKIRKTVRAWSHALKVWEQDRDVTQPKFDKATDDEGLRDGLRVCLDRLGEDECGLSV